MSPYWSVCCTVSIYKKCAQCHYRRFYTNTPGFVQCAKKVMAYTLGLVDVVVWSAHSVLCLPDKQFKLFGGNVLEGFQITELLLEMKLLCKLVFKLLINKAE